MSWQRSLVPEGDLVRLEMGTCGAAWEAEGDACVIALRERQRHHCR